MATKKYDLIVIGGGSGGLVSAAGAAGLGAKVALIEKKKLGGDCLNTGCVPSKALIRSARAIRDMRRAREFGIRDCQFQFEFADIMHRIREIQKKIEPHDSPERFRGLGVDVRFGIFSFRNAHELTDGADVLYGKRIVIATGSSPLVPPIPGCEERRCITTENIWEMRVLPKRFAIIGAGPIGSEIAQCFARFGSHVTLIDIAPGILPREDGDMKGYVEGVFQAEGIEFKFNTKVVGVRHEPDHHVLNLERGGRGEEIVCDEIFIAVGRRANIGGLELERVGIATDKRGIAINDYCQTSLPHVFACGDVTGPYLFTHFADYQARIVLRNAFFPGKKRVDYRVVPWCTYTDPELSRVGLSESEALEKKLSFDLHSFELSDLDRAICDGDAMGKMKVITRRGSDEILGGAIVGAHAGDLIQEIAFAMKNRLGLKAILNTIHPYPTFGESIKKVAEAWLRARFRPWMKGLFCWYFRNLLK